MGGADTPRKINLGKIEKLQPEIETETVKAHARETIKNSPCRLLLARIQIRFRFFRPPDFRFESNRFDFIVLAQ